MHVTSALSVFPVSFSSEAVVGICPSSFVSYLRFLQPTYVTIYATTVLLNCCTITFINHSSECLHTRVISFMERVPTEAYRIILRPRSPGTTETHESADVAWKLWLKQHIWIWFGVHDIKSCFILSCLLRAIPANPKSQSVSHMIRISVDQVKKWSDGSHDNDLLAGKMLTNRYIRIYSYRWDWFLMRVTTVFVDSMAIGSGQISKNFDADHLLSLSNAEKIKKMSHCMWVTGN